MKGVIKDNAALSSLQPLEVVAYLRAAGWTVEKSVPGKEITWVKPSDEDIPFEVRVPLDRKFRDFAPRMSDVLTVLEVVEKRSQFEIFRDLQTTTTDLIRIRLLAAESADGTLPIEQGVELVGHARDLVMASACVAAQPRQWYRRRRPPAAEDYLRGVRLGQTEIGSYVITVLSRVPPALRNAGSKLDDVSVQPFERQVTNILATALEATRAAAEQSVTSGSLDAFQKAVNRGVTVNLCDALAGLAPDHHAHDGIRFEFSWSPTRPQTEPVPSKIVISPDAIEVIREAGRMLRETSPLEDVELRGFVIRLDQASFPQPEIATVSALIEGQRRNVRVIVDESHRQLAINAYTDRLPVVCTGDVTRDGRALAMMAPRYFAIDNES